MKKHVAFVIVLLAALGTLFGVTATAAHANTPTHYWIVDDAGVGWCIKDPGLNQTMATGPAYPHCNANFTWTDPRYRHGYWYYLIRINGGSDCLDYDGAAWVDDHGCQAGKSTELWRHDGADVIYNYIGSILTACNNTGNSALYASPFAPSSRCNLSTSGQYQWFLYPV